MSSNITIIDKVEYDEEKAAEVFKSLRESSEPPKYSADWYRLRYPNFEESYYEAFENFSNKK